jgi:Phage integrase, N-terminal SAM-like domain
MSQQIIPPRARASLVTGGEVVLPRAIAAAGEHAARRFLEFFAATIRNKNTRMAYYRAACSFFAWLEEHGIVELVDIEPMHVAAYVEALQDSAAKPTVKQHLAAVRILFDWLVIGQIIASGRRLSHDPPPHRRSRLQAKARLPRVSRDRHHRLSRGLAAPSKTPRRWRRTKAHARRSSTTAPVTRSRSMRSSGSQFEVRRNPVFI